MKNKTLMIFMSLILTLFMVGIVSADPTTYYVDSSLENNNATHFKTIQYAIDEAVENSIIYVSVGTYKENVTINKSNLTLISTFKHEAKIEGKVSINANNIMLKNFYIDYPGIKKAPLDLINVENLTLIGNKVKGGQDTGGISAWTGPAKVYGEVLIKDN